MVTPIKAINLYKSGKKFTWHIHALSQHLQFLTRSTPLIPSLRSFIYSVC